MSRKDDGDSPLLFKNAPAQSTLQLAVINQRTIICSAAGLLVVDLLLTCSIAHKFPGRAVATWARGHLRVFSRVLWILVHIPSLPTVSNTASSQWTLTHCRGVVQSDQAVLFLRVPNTNGARHSAKGWPPSQMLLRETD